MLLRCITVNLSILVYKMPHLETAAPYRIDWKPSFVLFGIWSFITLCRPQDYLSVLAILRPSLTFGLIALVVFLPGEGGGKFILKDGQFRLFLALIAIMVLGIPFSYYRSASLLEIFKYASVSVLFFILQYYVVNTVERLKSLLLAYCCGASAYAMCILVFGRLASERIAFGTMFDPNDTAFFILNFIAFNFLFLKPTTSLRKKIIVIANITLCLVVMFKTGSRGGFIACIAVFTYLLFVKTKTVNISFFKKMIIVLTAFMLLLSISMNTERYRSILDVSSDYNIDAETGRLSIWKAGMRMMLSNPLTGVGVGRFYEGVGRDRQERGLLSWRWQAAHNSFVQIGAETGVIGFILFIVMSSRVFVITGRVRIRSSSNDLVRIAEMARAGFLGHLLSAMFLSQAYSIYWVFYIALSASMQRMLEEESA